jgi:uncharacterized delta-60 repeat protein
MAFTRGPKIITDGLVLYLDAANPKSYIGSGTSWKDLKKVNNGTLTNGPVFDTEVKGNIVFDGVNDFVNLDSTLNVDNTNGWTATAWYKLDELSPTSNENTIFGNVGSTVTPGWYRNFVDFLTDVWAIDIDPSTDKIYVGGSFRGFNGTFYPHIIRLNSDGTVDTSFVVGDGFFLNNSTARTIFSIKVSSTGKIYVGGNFLTYKNSSINRIIRLNTDGSVDTTFNVGTGFNSIVRSIIEDSNGDLYVGGDFTSYKGTSNNNRVIKLDSSGDKITSFDNSTGFNTGLVWNLSLNSDETILYCAGTFTAYKGTTRNRLAAINTSNGSLNTTFNTSVGANSTVVDILPTSSGIYVTGSFTSVNGTSINRIARLQTNGNVDTGFNVGAGANNTGYSLIEDSSGNIYFGGVFTSYKGTTINRIVKIDSSGDIDTSFNVGNGTNSNIYKLKQDSDGKILLGGAFSSYNSTGRLRLARANTNGSSDTTLSIGSGFDRGYHRFRFIYYYRNASNTLTSLSVFPGSFTTGYRAIEEINDDITEKWIQSTVTVGPDENFKVYFNGELKSTNPLPAGSQDIGFSITKLGTYASTSGPLKGNLSLVKVYDRRLSDDEILQNYNATKYRFGL